MNKVIFLDIDGVLNQPRGKTKTKEKTPMKYLGVDNKYLVFLKQLVDETKADIVLTSDWKDLFKDELCDPEYAEIDGKYLVSKLAEFDLKIAGKTDDRSVGSDYTTGRGFGIRKYLKYHPDIENYVILDDRQFTDFTGELLEHFVRCDCPFGKRNYNKAIKILNDDALKIKQLNLWKR